MMKSSVFRVAQKAFIKNDKGEMLLLRFSSSQMHSKALWGTYDFPGGGLESDESMEEGLLRELREEIGEDHNIEIGDPCMSWDFLNTNPDKQHIRTVIVAYDAIWKGGKIVLNEEHDEYAWALPEQFHTFPWSVEYKTAVERYVLKQQKGMQ
jgi:8-oxo-dGTP pyrophosphatase MutT (NUDIX family)